MQLRIFIPILILTLFVPLTARAVDQETLDLMLFLIQQPEGNPWNDGTFDDQTLEDGLEALYDLAVSEDWDEEQGKIIWAMGETTLPAFIATLTGALAEEPNLVLRALGKIPSEDVIDPIIGMLDDDDMRIRNAAVQGLHIFPAYGEYPDAMDDALDALTACLLTETEDWILENIREAIAWIDTQ